MSSSPTYESSLDDIEHISPDWKYHHNSQHFVWEREGEDFLIRPIEIEYVNIWTEFLIFQSLKLLHN